MNPPPSLPKKHHSFRPLLFAPPQGAEALPPTLPPPPPVAASRRSADDSHIRLRPQAAQAAKGPRATDIELLDARDLLDELCEDQLTMSLNLACLEESVAQAPRSPSSRAALRVLEARLADLVALRDGLATLHASTVDPRLQRVVLPEAPLAEYMRGLYAWAHAVLRALDQLACSLRTLAPDWALLRWRIVEAKNFHFDELHEPIRAELIALTIVSNAGSFGAAPPPIEDLQYAVERLFSTGVALEKHLDERFA